MRRALPKIVTHHVSPQRDVPAPQLRIALVADLHACWPWMTTHHIGAIVDQTNALQVDLIVLLGDYAGHVWGSRPLNPADVTRELSRLKAPLGAHAIMGNHDWKDDAQARRSRQGPTHWHHAFDAAGLSCLHNRTVQIDVDGTSFTLAGLDSQRAFSNGLLKGFSGADDLPAIAPQLDPNQFTILLAHEPDIFPDLETHIDLTLCGHMHAGQISPFGRALVAPSKFGTRYAYGLYKSGTRQMVVSGGLGYSGPPLRIGAPPEITLVEIQ